MEGEGQLVPDLVGVFFEAGVAVGLEAVAFWSFVNGEWGGFVLFLAATRAHLLG